MEFYSLLQGVIEVSISLVTGLLIFFTSFKVFTILTRDIDEVEQLKKNNIAVALLVSSFVFGIMLMVKSSIAPAVEALSLAIHKGAGGSILNSVLRVLIIYVVAAVFAFIVIWISLKVFMILTKDIDEMEEIGKNNYSIALVLTSLIASIALIMSKPLETILQSAVPMKFAAANAPLIEKNLLMAGAIQMLISFFGVIFILFISLKTFDLLTRNIDETAELKSNNFAVSVLLSAFLFSMMLIMQGPIGSANGTLLLSLQQKAGIAGISIAIGKILLYFIMAAVFSFIVLWIAMKAFMMLTSTIDEMTEIKNNKTAVSIVIAVLLISTALLVASGLPSLLEGIVPLNRILTNIPKP